MSSVSKPKFNGKLKKEVLGKDWQIKLVQNVDILNSLAKFKNVKKIGFKLEFDKQNAIQNAKKMLIQKKLDAVCLNVLGENISFGSDLTKISFITKNNIEELAMANKEQVAQNIVDLARNL